MNKLFVVGLGPGGAEFLTPQAREALSQAQVLCGYGPYVRQAAALFPQKETYTTGMTGELARCRWALQAAAQGRTVAMVCSGDAGVYGMAAPLLQLAEQYPDVEVQPVAGVTAALSGAAVLGAPLGHDFCAVSLSDLLTPWQVIEKRLRAAAAGDFAICLYNPGSRRRVGYLRRACDILLAEGKSPETVCGWVRNIGREGQQSGLTTLQQLREWEPDMSTTVFIGAAATRLCGGRMVTPRGYENLEQAAPSGPEKDDA